MSEKPVLMSTPIVQAILADKKTMTRRVIKPCSSATVIDRDRQITQPEWVFTLAKCPYQVGDHLWVRETWRESISHGSGYMDYLADYMNKPLLVSWRPSIFMPKWAARLWLEVTAVRAERLQDITESDAKNEGATDALWHDNSAFTYENQMPISTYKAGFANLWDSINAKRGHPWSANDRVWVYTFKRIDRGMQC